MEQQYYLATVPNPAPQSIPAGFGGHFDWSAIDDTEKARRGWVRAAPPEADPNFERVEVSFVQDEDGVWRASYAIVPGGLDRALAAAYAAVAAKRYAVEVGGLTYNGQTIPTDREVTQPRVEGAAAKAKLDRTFEVRNWKLAPGVFVTLANAELIALGDAMTAHVQGCFDREAAISALLAAKKKTETLRATLETEIDQGWPA